MSKLRSCPGFVMFPVCIGKDNFFLFLFYFWGEQGKKFCYFHNMAQKSHCHCSLIFLPSEDFFNHYGALKLTYC